MEIDSVTVLEWVAFSSALLTIWCYGTSKMHGAIVGMITAVLFIIWGFTAEVFAASATNIIFLGLHARNCWKATGEKL